MMYGPSNIITGSGFLFLQHKKGDFMIDQNLAEQDLNTEAETEAKKDKDLEQEEVKKEETPGTEAVTDEVKLEKTKEEEIIEEEPKDNKTRTRLGIKVATLEKNNDLLMESIQELKELNIKLIKNVANEKTPKQILEEEEVAAFEGKEDEDYLTVAEAKNILRLSEKQAKNVLDESSREKDEKNKLEKIYENKFVSKVMADNPENFKELIDEINSNDFGQQVYTNNPEYDAQQNYTIAKARIVLKSSGKKGVIESRTTTKTGTEFSVGGKVATTKKSIKLDEASKNMLAAYDKLGIKTTDDEINAAIG